MVSEHFSWDEVVTTETGLFNEIPDTLKDNATRLAESVLEPLRVYLGPLVVNSWYRSPAVNKAVHGAGSSSHLMALAADIVPNGDVMKSFKMALTHIQDLPIDKIIFEHHRSSWIHIQTARGGETPRRMAFTAKPDANGNMVYARYEV